MREEKKIKKNSSCYKTQKLKENQTQKLEIQQQSKLEMGQSLTQRLKNFKISNSTTQIVIKLNKSNCDKPQKLKF